MRIVWLILLLLIFTTTTAAQPCADTTMSHEQIVGAMDSLYQDYPKVRGYAHVSAMTRSNLDRYEGKLILWQEFPLVGSARNLCSMRQFQERMRIKYDVEVRYVRAFPWCDVAPCPPPRWEEVYMSVYNGITKAVIEERFEIEAIEKTRGEVKELCTRMP